MPYLRRLVSSGANQLVVRLKELPLERRIELGPRFVSEAIADLPLVAALEEPERADLGEAVADIHLYTAEGDHSDIFARGKLTGRLAVACSRCVDRVEVPVDEDIAVSFLPADRVPADDQVDEADEVTDDEDVYPYEGESIDLTTLFRERLIMAVPFAPLCRQDCKGLCPVCGAELNAGECGCDRDVGDPRLAALRDLARQAGPKPSN